MNAIFNKKVRLLESDFLIKNSHHKMAHRNAVAFFAWSCSLECGM